MATDNNSSSSINNNLNFYPFRGSFKYILLTAESGADRNPCSFLLYRNSIAHFARILNWVFTDIVTIFRTILRQRFDNVSTLFF